MENDPAFLWKVAATNSATGVVYMFARTRDHLDAGVLHLWNAVFYLDCEVELKLAEYGGKQFGSRLQ